MLRVGAAEKGLGGTRPRLSETQGYFPGMWDQSSTATVRGCGGRLPSWDLHLLLRDFPSRRELFKQLSEALERQETLFLFVFSFVLVYFK